MQSQQAPFPVTSTRRSSLYSTKKDKDPTECANYRPLSLLNTDVKLLAKLLALRLEPLMSKLIHSDQTGFIKSRLSSDNVRRLLHVIDASSEIHIPYGVLSLDARHLRHLIALNIIIYGLFLSTWVLEPSL